MDAKASKEYLREVQGKGWPYSESLRQSSLFALPNLSTAALMNSARNYADGAPSACSFLSLPQKISASFEEIAKRITEFAD